MSSDIDESDDAALACLYYNSPKHVICDRVRYDALKEPVKPSEPTFWVFFGVCVLLVIICFITQGLILAVVSSEMTNMKVISEAGTEKNRRYAKRMIQFVKRHHLVLVSLILANATAASAIPIFLEKMTQPFIAILTSITAVLIFGEVLPISLGRKYNLPIGYYMSWLIWLLIGLFFIVSYPSAKLLDLALGKGHATMYKRKELCALVDIHGPAVATVEDGTIGCGRQKKAGLDLERLSADEVVVIKGALVMGHKTAKEVMVALEDVFMLPTDAVLDRALGQEIYNVGYSRIPVYEGERHNIIGVLLTRKLVIIDKSRAPSIGSIFSGPDADRYFCPPYLVDESTPLYDLLKQFQSGTSSHMAFVTTTDTADKESLILGVVTLEDLIEELLQEEIWDESDLQLQWCLEEAKVKIAQLLKKAPEKKTLPSIRPVSSVPSLKGLDQEESNAARKAAQKTGRRSTVAFIR